MIVNHGDMLESREQEFSRGGSQSLKRHENIIHRPSHTLGFAEIAGELLDVLLNVKYYLDHKEHLLGFNMALFHF